MGGASPKPKGIRVIKQSYIGRKYDRQVGVGKMAECRASSTSDEATTEYPGIVDTPRPEKIDWKDVILVQGMFQVHFYSPLSWCSFAASFVRAPADPSLFLVAFGWESSKQGGTWFESVKEKIPLLEVTLCDWSNIELGQVRRSLLWSLSLDLFLRMCAGDEGVTCLAASPIRVCLFGGLST